ncbi:MAG: hypothetical protein KKE86_00175 [Planctomycetes bacterium]|nr:hypothetical protein [Planctomycetota bacterium]MBU4397725.1 hypothetical protein [Planctomycetota bacterium]MCG2682744.1 hypothetical protein [Planctomycetales bacterium]
MKMETLGTVVAGALRLDKQLELPDQSRVRVAVEPLDSCQSRFRAGLESWKAFCEEHPVHAGGKRYSRDELHERR